MDALTIMNFISMHGGDVLSLSPISKSEDYFRKLVDSGQVILKFSKGKLIGVATYYRTPTEDMGKIDTSNWTLPPIYNKGPYLFADQIVVHPKYRGQKIMEHFIRKFNELMPPVKQGMWYGPDGVWHKQEREANMRTNCGIVAFDKISGMLNGRSNVISLATLTQIAQDNEFLLYPMKVKSSELDKLQTPYILHSDFHFETILDPMDLLGVPLEEEVYVLATTPDVGEIVDTEEAKKVRGSKKFWKDVMAPMLGMGGGSILGGLLGTAVMPGLGTVLGATLGGAGGGALSGPLAGRAPSWGQVGGGALAGLGTGLTMGALSGLGAGAGAAGSAGAAGGQTGASLGYAGLGSGAGTGAFGSGIGSAASMGIGGSGAAGLGSIGGAGLTFGTNFAGTTAGLGAGALGNSLGGALSSYNALASSSPASSISSVPRSAFSVPLNSASIGSGAGANMLNPMGTTASTIGSTAGAGGSSMPSLVPAAMGSTGGGGGGNILSQMASGAGKLLSGGGAGNVLKGAGGGMLSKLGMPGLLGAGMLGFNMLRKNPSIDTSAYDDYAKQMQMMYASGGSSPYAAMAIPELQRGIGAGVQGIFPSTDSAWYTTQLANKEQEMKRAEEALGNQYAAYGRVNSPEFIQALSDVRAEGGRQMDTLKAQMAETNRSQNIAGMQTYLQLAMQGDQNAFAALANALGGVAEAKMAADAYAKGFQESKMNQIGTLGSTLVANQFNPMAGVMNQLYAPRAY